ALYSPGHPAARAAVSRLAEAITAGTAAGPLTLGVTPDTLMIDGESIAASQSAGIVAEAGAYLHDRDLLRLTFTGFATDDALGALLTLLAEEPASVRTRGGIAAAWIAQGYAGLEIEAIDYESMLGEPEKEV